MTSPLNAWRSHCGFDGINTWADDDDDDDDMMLQFMKNARQPQEPLKRGGSVPGRKANINRDRLRGNQRLYKDYFAESPVYDHKLFRRRFRMRLIKIVVNLPNIYE